MGAGQYEKRLIPGEVDVTAWVLFICVGRAHRVGVKKWDPFRDILFLQERMSRLLDDALMKYYKGLGGAEGLAGCAWTPPVDIYETEDTIALKAEIPGVDIEDVSIEVDENTLLLKGERRPLKHLRQENYHRMERYYGVFTRTFCLPNIVDKKGVKASLRDGVLEITVPKLKEPHRESIKVEVE